MMGAMGDMIPPLGEWRVQNSWSCPRLIPPQAARTHKGLETTNRTTSIGCDRVPDDFAKECLRFARLSRGHRSADVDPGMRFTHPTSLVTERSE